MTLLELVNHITRYAGRGDIASFPGLAEGTNANTLKTVNAITYGINGIQYSKAATDNIAMSACAQQAISRYCLYLVSINAAGTVTVTKGTEVATDTATLPATPALQVAIGAFKVQTNGSQTFTSGSVDLSTAGLTVTYYDFDCGMVTKAINQTIWNLEHKYSFRCMKVRTTAALAVSSYEISNPITNYKKLLSTFAVDTDGVAIPVKRVSYQEAMTKYPDLVDDVGTPEMFCDEATAESSLTPDIAPTHKIIFRPTTTASDSYTVTFYGYQYSPELDGCIYTTNWWTQNAWNVLLYGALAELESYLMNDPRIGTWKQLYADAVKLLTDTEVEEELSGSYQNVESDYVV